MGGSIQVTSTLGQGSTFTFDLQVSLIEPSQLETILITKQVKYLAPGQPDYRIAIADDRESNRLVLEKLLNSVGFNTRTATNGQEAIALWQDWQPHLIWMDMRMPILDGYAATRQIKSQPDGKNTVIIALTASAFEEQREEVLAAGCDDFVRKPFTEQVIFNKLAKYLGVKYTYETPSDFVELQVPQIVSKIPITQQISSLPPELISQIHQAAIAVDGEQIKQLITSIPPTHQTVASAIAQMNRNYDFDAIIDLTAKSK
jgi:CheY-like chemotaxis protein